MTGRYWKRKNGSWAIAVYVDGQEQRESVARAIGKPAGEVTERDAIALLEYRKRELAQGRYVPLVEAKRPFRELFTSYLEDVRLRERHGPDPCYQTMILDRWGTTLASNITPAAIRRWATDLGAKGYAPGTCVQAMAYLRAALRLAVADNRLGRMPTFPKVRLRNARQGFFEPEQFTAVHRHLVDPINDLVAFYYEVGWRKAEVTGLRWDWVERGVRIILPDSKSDEGRVVPLTGRVAEIIERRWAKRQYRRPDGTTALAEDVFHRQGKPVRSFDKQWESACAKAGVRRYVHDFRRTVARDGMEAGNDPFAVMRITGHKSLSTFQRYNIIDTRRVAAALQRTEEYRDRRAATVTDIARTARAAGEPTR